MDLFTKSSERHCSSWLDDKAAEMQTIAADAERYGL